MGINAYSFFCGCYNQRLSIKTKAHTCKKIIQQRQIFYKWFQGWNIIWVNYVRFLFEKWNGKMEWKAALTGALAEQGVAEAHRNPNSWTRSPAQNDMNARRSQVSEDTEDNRRRGRAFSSWQRRDLTSLAAADFLLSVLICVSINDHSKAFAALWIYLPASLLLLASSLQKRNRSSLCRVLEIATFYFRDFFLKLAKNEIHQSKMTSSS